MPVMFVNPGRRRKMRKVVRRGGRKLYGAAAMAVLRKRGRKARRNPAHPTLAAAKATYAPAKKTRTRRKRRKLYGAAAAAHARKMGTKTPSARKRRRRKARKVTPQGAMTMAKAKKKRRSKKRRKSAAPKKSRRKKRKSTSRKRRRKSSKRSRAAKKAARTRKAKKARRKAAAKKAARSRKRKGGSKRRRRSRKASTSRKRRRSRSRSRKGGSRRRRRSRRRTGVKALRRARRTIRYQRRRGGRAAKSYMKRYRMRSNPGIKGIVGALKKAVPYGVGFFGSRLLAGKLPSLPVVGGLIARLGTHAGPVAAVGMVALAAYSHKVPVLGKMAGRHRDALVTGAALNAIATVVSTYLPSVAGFLGMGEYVRVGEYVQSGEYFEQGEYVQELGEYYGAAAGDFYGDMGGMEAAVPSESGLIAATQVPGMIAAEPFSVEGLNQGIFAPGN